MRAANAAIGQESLQILTSQAIAAMTGTSSAKTRGTRHRAALCADPLALLPGRGGLRPTKARSAPILGTASARGFYFAVQQLSVVGRVISLSPRSCRCPLPTMSNSCDVYQSYPESMGWGI